MRPEPNYLVEPFRRVHPMLGPSPLGANCGYFEVQVPGGGRCSVIASAGRAEDLAEALAEGIDLSHLAGWEHVSVSLPGRCPSWEELCFVKNLFWSEEETVLQFHPKRSAYVNRHRYCLHLWKQAGVDAELPPRELIA
jgi:hypothetical protein